MEGGLHRDIRELNTHVWRGKRIRLFINGDYAFLCKIYGLSGPSGSYPCLWCLVPKHILRIGKTHSQQRTLTTLHTDNTHFIEQELGDKNHVAKHHNSLHAPLIDVELDMVTPPYLHILLGIVIKHHRLLELAAHDIDINISSQLPEHLTDLGSTLQRYGKEWQRVQYLQEKLEFEQSCLIFSETEEDKAKYQEEVNITEHSLSLITHKDLTPRSGPVASSLDTILKTHRITPQAYHSRSFIGNHCHKYLHPTVYRELTQSIITTTKAYTNNPLLIDHAHLLELKFNTLNEAFSKVHTAISHTKAIKQDSLTDIQKTIDNYMTAYRHHVPKKTTPKQHILEHHCVPFIHKHVFGLGLLGEQGTEKSHQSIAKLEKRACGIGNESDKLMFILRAHFLLVSPALHYLK